MFLEVKMTICEVILFIVSSIGLTHILIDGSIFEPLRNFVIKYLPKYISSGFTCYMCLGFWMSMVCAWLVFDDINIKQILACGFAGSFLSMLGAVIITWFQFGHLDD
jgi:hypothetical protein